MLDQWLAGWLVDGRGAAGSWASGRQEAEGRLRQGSIFKAWCQCLRQSFLMEQEGLDTPVLEFW